MLPEALRVVDSTVEFCPGSEPQTEDNPGLRLRSELFEFHSLMRYRPAIVSGYAETVLRKRDT
jgi:hypothetical protein